MSTFLQRLKHAFFPAKEPAVATEIQIAVGQTLLLTDDSGAGEVLVDMQHRETRGRSLGTSPRGNSGLSDVYRGARTFVPRNICPFQSQLAMPLIDENDPWAELALVTYRKEMAREKFYFTAVSELMEALKIELSNHTRPAFKKLMLMSCIKYEDMPRAILQQCPHLVNYVISSGQISHPSIEDEFPAIE